MIDTREIATAKIVMVGGNGGGGGTSNYNQLNNKPSINGVTLQGNKTSADLNISGMPENPLATSHGGTGNADGYIRKGVAQGSTVGNGATAEGYGNTVSGDYSHAEGSGNTASSYHTHAEGSTNTASAPQAHAEGYGTTASGAHSHAGGAYTVAGYANQTVIGRYNKNKSTSLFEVGNGADASNKSNAFEVYANGDIVAGGTVSDANGTLNAVIGNPSDTASSIIDKIKIGARTYDTSAIKPYTATNITTSAITISIGLAEASALNGRIIAVNTGSRSGTPSNAWGVNILYNGGGSSVGCAILKSDGTAFTDAVTANEVLFLSMDMTNLEATIVNIAGASGGGGASTLANLTDTDITSPTDGQVLTYNGTTGKWGNQTPSGVAESVVGTVENGTTASQPYAVGEHFIRNDKFCTVIAAIASGATLTQGTNYVEGSISQAIARACSYPSSEIEIGTWLGQRLYRKVIDTGVLPNATYKTVSTGLSNIKIVKMHGVAYRSDNTIPLPSINTNAEYNVALSASSDGGTIYIECAKDRSAFTTSYVVLEYIKTA